MTFSNVRPHLWWVVLALCVSPLVAQPAAAFDPFRDSTFAEFCRENPTLNQPVGVEPVWVEWLVAEGSEMPDQPTPEMLQTGRLIRQVTRSNRCANTEQWQLVDRAPNGTAMANPRHIGSALFTRVVKLKDGSIDLDFRAALVPPPAWVTTDAGVEPVYERAEHSSHLTLRSGEWIKVGGSSAARVTKTTDGKEISGSCSRAFYLRVLLKPKTSAAAH